MYFSTINNQELKHFHKVAPYNFNISLTDILSSDLFHIETVIPNKLYRIALLFYCQQVTSSNVDDVILDNKCIICHKTDKETYFNFISDENDNFILNYKSGYYSLEDKLSDEDFNSIVQLLRVNNSFTEDIQINNSTVNSKYGTYVFNLKSTTILDTGVLITNETLSNIGTVKLLNPTFKNSNYKLNLKVYTVSDVNIINDVVTDNIEETDLIIDLIPDTDVVIPFDTLDLNCIVGFNATVNITHDLPVIQYPNIIVITTNKMNYIIGEKITLKATYTYMDSPLENEIITFKNNNTVLGTATTNSKGIATFTYTPVNADTLNIIATSDNDKVISKNIAIKIDKKPTTLSMNINKTTIEINENIVITGVLKYGNELLSNRTVKIMDANQVLYSVTTDANGSYSKIIPVTNVCSYDFKVVFDGDSIYAPTESNYVNVKGVKISLGLRSIRWAIAVTASLRGVLINGSGNPLSNFPLKIRWIGQNTDVTEEFQTDEKGFFEKTYPTGSAISTINLIYDGDETHGTLNAKFNR